VNGFCRRISHRLVRRQALGVRRLMNVLSTPHTLRLTLPN
jgi:hypothetical protein